MNKRKFFKTVVSIFGIICFSPFFLNKKKLNLTLPTSLKHNLFKLFYISMHWLNLLKCIKVKFKNNLKINVISIVVIYSLSISLIILIYIKGLDSDAVEDVCAIEEKKR